MTMKSGCAARALMRVIWVAIWGSSGPKVSSPRKLSAPANSFQRFWKVAENEASKAVEVSRRMKAFFQPCLKANSAINAAWPGEPVAMVKALGPMPEGPNFGSPAQVEKAMRFLELATLAAALPKS